MIGFSFYGFSAALEYGSRPRFFLFDDTAVYRLSGYGLCLCSSAVVCFSCSGFFNIRDSLDSGAKLDGKSVVVWLAACVPG